MEPNQRQVCGSMVGVPCAMQAFVVAKHPIEVAAQNKQTNRLCI